MHRSLRTVLGAVLGALLLAGTVRAEILVLGYTDVAGPGYNHLEEIPERGSATNVAFVNFEENWTTTDLPTLLRDFQTSGLRAALILDHLLFKRFPAVSSSCRDAQGLFATRLRANWRNRLARFAEAYGARVTPATTRFLVVQTEVNNICVPLDDVEAAAVALKAAFPGIPLVMGYGRSLGAQPAPESIPPDIDWVGFYKYGIFDPAQPGYSQNADDQYLVEFESLLAKLDAHQRVLLGPDAFWADPVHGHLYGQSGPGSGWPRWYLRYVALNYERFAKTQPKVVGMFFFRWSNRDPDIVGTVDLPPVVRDAHREIGCRNLGCR
ncbi:MAG TPA: hypothetical protein VFE33_00910 [Thermoanaerobaculia bacterium]|nr:hypothetical protein [Thermoanaerobaculia bacterium]